MTQIVGILNVTPDSYSDGGKYLDKDHAISHAKLLIEQGADILDIGAESTSQFQWPRASKESASEDQEWIRLKDALPEIVDYAHQNNVKVSVDSRNFLTIEKILKAEIAIDIVNDVTGGDDSRILDLVAKTNISIVVMHHLGVPPRPEINISDVNEVKNWLIERVALCKSLGIAKDRIIIDPGIGFGKTAEQSLKIIKNIAQYKDIGCRILLGHSRKSFFKLFTDKPAKERDLETYVTSIYLAKQNIDYIRVHDVEGNIRAIKIAQGLY